MKLLLLFPLYFLMHLAAPAKVYICRSPKSYAYHNRMCQGLRACTHVLDTVSIKVAIALGKGKACGYCYR